MDRMGIKYVVFLIVAAATTCAQSQETPVYLEQFQNLNANMDRIMDEVVKGQIQDSTWSRLFALQKLTHHLQESAGEADGQARRSGARPDKRLLLIEQGCMAMDYVLKALGRFIDTDDRLFITLAADTGTVNAGIRVALKFCRKMKTTRITNSSASHSVVMISLMPARTERVVSSETT